jgi:hypothetical protein
VTALGMFHHALASNAVSGRPMTNAWYFMGALPFLFVLVVKGLAVFSERLAVLATASLAVLFVAIDLHGTWVQMPNAYASTTEATLKWARLTAIHPTLLRGELRWVYLAIHLAALSFVVGALAHRSRSRSRVNDLTT